MTVNEVNLLMSLFFIQHKGKRICDVIKDCHNKDLIYSLEKYQHSKTYMIVENLTYTIISYSDTEESFYYWSHTHSNTNGRQIYFNILDYISFKDQI